MHPPRRGIRTGRNGAIAVKAASEIIANVVVGQATQTITFGALGSKTTADSPVSLVATASSGLPVVFSSTTTTVCTVSGVSLTLLTTGICTIAADQAGNAGYAPATQVMQSFTVGESVAQIYYVHPDHLGTPRAITTSDASNTKVWAWSNLETFGNNVPDENPSGLGNFTYNNGFPGQYFDQETNTSYNYFRDYDPSIGRYVQSDPIGLRGGINTYGYVEGDPLHYVDSEGLDRWGDDPSLKYPIKYSNADPVHPETEAQVLCMMNKLGGPLVITGGTEPGHKSAAKGGKHPIGQAVDFGANNNPLMTPELGKKEAVNRAACECNFTNGGWEPDFIKKAARHYHFQNGEKPSNVPKLQCDKNGCTK
jgi:RHS repeat-associated protein